jgi:hypothetical protein
MEGEVHWVSIIRVIVFYYLFNFGIILVEGRELVGKEKLVKYIINGEGEREIKEEVFGGLLFC